MSDSPDKIRRAFAAAARAPRPELYEKIVDLTLAVESGEIVEFKVVATRRGIDILTTRKEQYE